MLNYEAKWYTIPGFTSYDININTREVRSNKHFNRDSHHIMKVSDSGKVTIVDDRGKPTRISVDNLYTITFKSGYRLNPRGDHDIYKSGMVKGMRNVSTVDMNDAMINDGGIYIDFYKIITESNSSLTKPFTIDLKGN